MGKRTLITCALLYANGPLHLGHLVGYIQTDIYTRFLKLMGENAAYVCADDTHGAPVQIKAEEQGITPEELIEKMFHQHVKDFKEFKVEFDEYYTTHSKENREYADKLFNLAYERGYIYKKEVDQLYCGNCERFLPDRYVKGKCPKCNAEEQYGDVCEKCGASYNPTELVEPNCAICGQKPEERSSSHYFFRLTEFSEQLKEWLENNKNLQKEIVNSIKYWIDSGLEDWDISRDAPYFGFKMPGEDSLYYYVWWDAPIGYIASAEHYLQKMGLGSAEDYYFTHPEASIVHFIGKDIIYFHFLFWPAMLMACGYNLPEDIVVNGFLTINGEKMSKSRGTFITAKEFLDNENDPEHVRYYFARMLSKKLADVDFNEEEFKAKINNELLANVANFCYRVVGFSNKHFDGEVSKAGEKPEEVEKHLKNIKESYHEMNFRNAMDEVLHLSTVGNRHFQENEPWKLVKTDKEEVEKVLNTCLNIVKFISVSLKPVMPALSAEIESQLNTGELDFNNLKWQEEFNCNKAKLLLNKLEEDVIKKKKMPFNLKTAKVVEAKPHPDAEKLMVVKVDIGGEERQVVAGLREHYDPEDIKGKNVVVVENLEEATLRGEKSQGMVLAADDGKTVQLVETNSEPGERVYIESHEDKEGKTTFKEFQKSPMQVYKGEVYLKGKKLGTAKETLKIDMEDGSKVR